jgi:hypothetical protein
MSSPTRKHHAQPRGEGSASVDCEHLARAGPTRDGFEEVTYG